jgi:hypothetical protein
VPGYKAYSRLTRGAFSDKGLSRYRSGGGIE